MINLLIKKVLIFKILYNKVINPINFMLKAIFLYIKYAKNEVDRSTKIVSFNEIKNALTNVNDYIEYELDLFKNSKDEYIFISFNTRNSTILKNMAMLLFNLFETYKDKSKLEFLYFNDTNHQKYSNYFPDSYLLNFLQTICNLYCYTNLGSYAVRNIDFNTCIKYKRTFDNFTVDFFLSEMSKGHHTMLLSNCLICEDDFYLMYKMYMKINSVRNLSPERYNYFLNFSPPNNDNEKPWVGYDIHKYMLFAKNEITDLTLEFGQINLKSAFNKMSKVYNKVGYEIYHGSDASNLGERETPVFVQYDFKKINFDDRLFLKFRVKYEILKKNIIKKSNFLYPFSTFKVKRARIHFRTSLGILSFEFVHRKYITQNFNTFINCNFKKSNVEYTSIYYLKNDKKILYGNFLVFQKKRTRTRKFTIPHMYNKKVQQGQYIVKNFINNLTTYINRNFCMINRFLSHDIFPIDYNKFLCHFDIKKNFYLFDIKHIDSWGIFSKLCGFSLNFNVIRFKITLFEAIMNKNPNHYDYYDCNYFCYKNFKIKRKIITKMSQSQFKSLNTILIAIRSLNNQFKRFYYILIPIKKLFYTNKIRLFHNTFINEQNRFFGIDSKFNVFALKTYITRVLYVTGIRQIFYKKVSLVKNKITDSNYSQDDINYYMITYALQRNLYKIEELSVLLHKYSFDNSHIVYKKSFLLTELYKELHILFNKNMKFLEVYKVIISALVNLEKKFEEDCVKYGDLLKQAVLYISLGNCYADDLELPYIINSIMT